MSSADSVSLRSRSRLPRKLCQGWLEHKSQTATGTRYDRLWFLLEDNFIFIFKTDEATKESQIGSLSIDKHTVFRSESGGSHAGGFKFDLTTGTRKNRFKTRKSSERELWRGYILGVATGTVPDDLDLLEDQVKTIRDNVMAYHTGQPAGQFTNRVSFISGGSGDSGVGEAISMHSGFSRPSACGSGSGSASGGSGGGPTMKNKFYNEMSRDQETPSWFFSGCSREKAEEILTRCSNHGNTLMRESTSHMKNGSYVISRRIFDKATNDYTYEHFEVMRVAGGYKLNVQNEHQPMRCLSDVMDYFKETSGGSTRFMDTNDPYRFGLKDDPEYQRHIRTADPEPWSWPPPDYDDAQEAGPRNPGIGANTLSPGILKNVKGPGPKKSVEFNARTYGGSSRRSAPQQTTFDDIVHRSNAAAHLRDLDHMIHGFDTDNVYQNENPLNNPEIDATPNGSVSRSSMPLPPTPHQIQQHSYINDGHDSTLESLPVAPPPPRSTAVKRPASIASSLDVLFKVTQPPFEDFLDYPSVVDSLPIAPPPPHQNRSPHAHAQNEFVEIVNPRQTLPETYQDSTCAPPPAPTPAPPPAPPPPPPLPTQTGFPPPCPGQVVHSPGGRVSSPVVQHSVQSSSTPVKPVPKPAPKTAPKPASKPAASNSPLIGKGPMITRSKSSIQGQSPNVTLHHAQSAPDQKSLLEQDIINKRAQLTKTHSVDKGLGSHVNPKSPESMPVWDNKPPRSVGTPEISHTAPHGQTTPSAQHGQQQEVQSGIDDSNPGGVRNLSSMFEKSTQVSQPRAKPQRRGGGRLFDNTNRKSAPVFSLHTGSDRLQGQSADDYLHPAAAINTNSSLSNVPRNVNSRHFNNTSALGKESLCRSNTNTREIYDVYDDAAIPGSLPGGQGTHADNAERQTASPKPLIITPEEETFTGPSEEYLRRRRKTEPAVKFGGINESFKRKLEGVICVPQGAHGQSQADHVYEELPIIHPDAVTYANDIID